MSLEEMVATAYREARGVRVERLPHRRAAKINGVTVTDLDFYNAGMSGDLAYYTGGEATDEEMRHALSMIQLAETNVITRREAIERIPFV